MKTNAGAANRAVNASSNKRRSFFIAAVLFCSVLAWAILLPAETPSIAEDAPEAAEMDLVFVDTPVSGASPFALEVSKIASVSEVQWSYQNDSLRIDIAEHQMNETVYFTVELWLSDIKQLQSAFSSNQFDSTTETVEDIALRQDAVLAINGDFATFNNGGIIIRNGELFRSNKSTRQLLTIDQNGNFGVYTEPPERAKDAAQEFLSQGIWHTCVFGPVLVENGQPVELPKKFFIKTTAHEPRTAIAQLGPLHYLVIIADGRQDGYSKGITLSELTDLFVQYGAQTAFNLDGGGSTTLFFDGMVLNQPANGHARRVPDIFFIAR